MNLTLGDPSLEKHALDCGPTDGQEPALSHVKARRGISRSH